MQTYKGTNQHPPSVRSQCGSTASRIVAAATVAILALHWPPEAHSAQIDIAGPAGSVEFGTSVTVLPNGNFVVTDPKATVEGKTYAGAVYLYSPDGSLISRLTGAHSVDRVGSGGVIVVGNSNFVVLSPSWNPADVSYVGAATWVNGTTGLDGEVTESNSLVGSHANDAVGLRAITLSNGHYVVLSSLWNEGRGAATWGDGDAPTVGEVGSTNSLYGTTPNDNVGLAATALNNGNYVVVSPIWQNGVADSGFGAVTWRDGSGPSPAAVSGLNSLHGTTVGDRIGVGGVTALANGNFVVDSRYWGNGVPGSHVGAVTWISGTTGQPTGAVTITNSLYGTQPNQSVGYPILALSDGNYVVNNRFWNNMTGAALWGNGVTGTLHGPYAGADGLSGANQNDEVGQYGVALENGEYLVVSQRWASTTGAITKCAANGACTGIVTAANSLTSNGPGGGYGLSAVALRDGNYVVSDSTWGDGINNKLGAVMWMDKDDVLSGQIDPGQALIGTHANDQVGDRILAVADGNYVVASLYVRSGEVRRAVTWVRGGGLGKGSVTEFNSFTGTPTAPIGPDIIALADGNYVIRSEQWSSSGVSNAGAITLANGRQRLVGHVAAWNSVTGNVAEGGSLLVHDYDPTRQRLVVGKRKENKVTLLTMEQIFADNFEP